ncbi:MAG: hypothetical protein IJ383_05855 [Bacteroidales bacterium]|nr:hypothetical protein [Bacteroidales bacterium]
MEPGGYGTIKAQQNAANGTIVVEAPADLAANYNIFSSCANFLYLYTS